MIRSCWWQPSKIPTSVCPMSFWHIFVTQRRWHFDTLARHANFLVLLGDVCRTDCWPQASRAIGRSNVTRRDLHIIYVNHRPHRISCGILLKHSNREIVLPVGHVRSFDARHSYRCKHSPDRCHCVMAIIGTLQSVLLSISSCKLRSSPL
jgi:hypothetical protein